MKVSSLVLPEGDGAVVTAVLKMILSGEEKGPVPQRS